ncbi:MAG: T9SS type A sorting domain-containing protein [Bacteroidales bacterium]|nr:T9SS type A sorting domain-containing protein [Bacteroidales bacterium]
MRKFIVFICLLAAFSESSGQGCLPEGKTFSAQSQIDNFSAIYPGCTEIQGNVLIGGSGNNLTNLNGLQQITRVDSNLYIGDWDVNGATSLAWLNGLNNLFAVGGNLEISGNYSLIGLSGLESLASIGKCFKLISDNNLENISDLENLQTIGSTIQLWHNNLNSLEGLGAIDSIGGDLIIDDCNSIQDLNGLQNLKTVGGLVNISENPELANLEGLNSLKSTGAGLVINNNPNLTKLDALSNLTEIGSNTLAITANISLNSIVGIENISPISISWLYLYYNPMLSYCHISNICEFLEIFPYENYISSNAEGCESSYDISAACEEVGVEDYPLNRNLKIYPNPVSGYIYIDTQSAADNFELSIHDVSGRIIINQQFSGTLAAIDVHYLESGVYFVKMCNKQKFPVAGLIKK